MTARVAAATSAVARVGRGVAATTRLVPALVALGMAVAGLVVAAGVGAAAGSLLAAVSPVDASRIDPLEASGTAVGLVALGVGLARRKRLAWWLAVCVFVAAVADPDALRYPVATGLAVGCLGILVADRRRYRVRSDRRMIRPVLAAAVLVVALIVVQAAVVDVAGPIWAAPVARAKNAVEAVADALALPLPDLRQPVPGVQLADIALDAARLLLVAVGLLALRALPGPRARGRDALRARSIAERYATGALRPFQLGDDKVVYSRPGADAVVVFGAAGRYAVMLGDPIGPRPAAALALRSFTESAELADRRPAAYQVSERWGSVFRRIGFRLVPIGAEAILDLRDFGLAGSRRANLRHTVTRARRGGVRVGWYGSGVADAGLAAALARLDEEWRQRQAGPRLRFTIHDFRPDERVPTAVAFEADGEPSAFATFQSTGDGTWVLDLIRRRRGTPGALESCIAEAAVAMAASGGRELSLGLAPLARLRADRAPEERLLALSARLVRRLYDVRGLEFFKDKFAPRWEPRYLALRSRLDLAGIVIALLWLHVRPSAADRRIVSPRAA